MLLFFFILIVRLYRCGSPRTTTLSDSAFPAPPTGSRPLRDNHEKSIRLGRLQKVEAARQAIPYTVCIVSL